MIATDGEEMRVRIEDLGCLGLDMARNFRVNAVIEGAVAVVDSRQDLERIEMERILRITAEDCRGPAHTLRAEAGTRPVGDRRVERNAPDSQIDAVQVAAIAAAHETQRPRIGRLIRAAFERLSQEGVVDWKGIFRIHR